MGCLTFIIRKIGENLTATAIRKDGEGVDVSAQRIGDSIKITASLICSIGEIDGYYLLDVDMIRFVTDDNKFLIVPEDVPQNHFYVEDISGHDNTVTITRNGDVNVSNVRISYDGISWKNIGTTKTTGELTIPLAANGRVYMRCIAESWNNVRISASGRHNIGGKITSLLYGDDKTDEINNVRGVFASLFEGNTMLVNASGLEIPSNRAPQEGYSRMFYGCTSLATAPELHATELKPQCYAYMFYGCTSLATAPELPATVLDNYCYYQMFRNCISLNTAPELPATILATNCYYLMFRGCVSLTEAPELPATTLVSGCYRQMFQDCTRLSHIKAMFTTTPSPSYTNNWVSRVAAEGTFEKNPDATWNVRGVNGIPEGWLVSGENHYFYVEDRSGSDNTIKWSKYNTQSDLTSIEYSYDGNRWFDVEYAGSPIEINIPASQRVYLRSHTTRWEGFRMSATEEVNIGGNILSLVYGVDNVLSFDTSLSGVFREIFSSGSNVVDASRLLLPKNVVPFCYYGMFSNCTSLTQSPELPAITLASYCYSGMFLGCTSLNYIKALFTTTPGPNYTQNWLYGVAATGTFVKNADAMWDVRGINGVPENWTIETE